MAGLLTAALALLALVAGAAPAQALAYDSVIIGKVVGPDGKPIQGLQVTPYTNADQPLSGAAEDSWQTQYSATGEDGTFSFKADSSTVYKVRVWDPYGGTGRNPLTFADKWYGGKSTFDMAAGYTSAKKITISTPGIVNLGTSTVVLGTLPKYGIKAPPVISGELKYGGVLFATPGTWSPQPAAGIAFTWYRGTDRVGTGQVYKVKAEDVGQSIRVVASAYQWGVAAYTESKSAAVTVARVKLPSPGVTIRGKAQVSNQLTAVLAVPVGLDQGTVDAMASPQWYRNGAPIRGATSLTYQPAPADAGTVLSFKAGGLIHPEVKTAKIAPRPFFSYLTYATIKGTPKPGSTLTVYTGAESWQPRPSAFTYQWYRSGVRIPGATAKSYKLTASDAGRTIMAKATGTRTGFLTTTSASVRALR
ncbi:hypothetical protein CFN17_10395 [Arthrobacter sp. PM3]|nr:hypothetical protein CFN17_10395 [Arthrobacter sp. PM3]